MIGASKNAKQAPKIAKKCIRDKLNYKPKNERLPRKVARLRAAAAGLVSLGN